MISFVNITVDCYADLPSHSLTTQTLDGLKDREECLDQVITALLKIVQCMAKQDIPFQKFKSVIDLIHELGGADCDI